MGRKGFIQLTFPHCYSSLKEVRTGTQAGQGAGVDAEDMEGCSLLACLSSSPDFLGVEQQCGSLSLINPFHPSLLPGHDVCAGIETVTKTLPKLLLDRVRITARESRLEPPGEILNTSWSSPNSEGSFSSPQFHGKFPT